MPDPAFIIPSKPAEPQQLRQVLVQIQTALRAMQEQIDAGGGGGAPTTSQYVTLATDATLTNERVLTAGSGISITDAGAGSTVTIAATGTGGLTSPQVLARSLGS